MGLTLVAFFLAMGVGAHALDELTGRPLRTRISSGTLVALAVVSVSAAAAIGVAVAVRRDLWLLVFVAAGCILVTAYNLELFGGRLHGEPWFALAWGAFPLLTAFFASAETIRVEAVVAAAFAALLSHAQRVLSTPVRDVRRRTVSVTGMIERTDGSRVSIGPETLTRPMETALRFMALATMALAAALLVLRFA